VYVLGGLAVLATSVSIAQAEDGCGRGRYYNGYRCAPIEQGGYHGPPDYRGGPPAEYYPPGVGPRARGQGDYGPQTTQNRDCYNVGGRRICCPKHWTVQDGVCKPYKGR
jgi:hypothetical protein